MRYEDEGQRENKGVKDLKGLWIGPVNHLGEDRFLEVSGLWQSLLKYASLNELSVWPYVVSISLRISVLNRTLQNLWVLVPLSSLLLEVII